jgi:hypothetical protein
MRNPLNYLDRVAVTYVLALVAGDLIVFVVPSPSPGLLLKCIFGGLALALAAASITPRLSFSLTTPARQILTLFAGALIVSSCAIATVRRFEPERGERAVQTIHQQSSAAQRNATAPSVRQQIAVTENLGSAVMESIREDQKCVEKGGPDARACAEDGRKNITWAEKLAKAKVPSDPPQDAPNPTSPSEPPGSSGPAANPPDPPISAPSKTQGVESSPLQRLLEALASPFGPFLKNLMMFGSSEEYREALRELAAQLLTSTPVDPTTVRNILASADDAQKAFGSIAQLASHLPVTQQVALRSALASNSAAVLKSKYLEEIVRGLDAGDPPQSLVALLPNKQFASPTQKLALQTVLLSTGRKNIWVSVFQDLPPIEVKK